MPNPQERARKARAAEVARAAKVERALVKAYQTAWGNLKAEVEKAAVTLKAAKATSTTAVYRQIEQATGQRLEGLAAAEIRYQVSLTAYRITDAQAGKLIVGRSGHPTRIEWYYGLGDMAEEVALVLVGRIS